MTKQNTSQQKKKNNQSINQPTNPRGVRARVTNQKKTRRVPCAQEWRALETEAATKTTAAIEEQSAYAEQRAAVDTAKDELDAARADADKRVADGIEAGVNKVQRELAAAREEAEVERAVRRCRLTSG